MSDNFVMGVHVGPAEPTSTPTPTVTINAPNTVTPVPAPAPVIPMAPTSTANEVATVAQSLRDAIKRANSIVSGTAASVAEFHRHLDVMEGRKQQLDQLNSTLNDAEQL
jgi:hypothetical protein